MIGLPVAVTCPLLEVVAHGRRGDVDCRVRPPFNMRRRPCGYCERKSTLELCFLTSGRDSSGLAVLVSDPGSGGRLNATMSSVVVI